MIYFDQSEASYHLVDVSLAAAEKFLLSVSRQTYLKTFLAPTGAQGVTMSVHPAQVCFKKSIFVFLGRISIKEQSEHSETIKTRSESRF